MLSRSDCVENTYGDAFSVKTNKVYRVTEHSKTVRMLPVFYGAVSFILVCGVCRRPSTKVYYNYCLMLLPKITSFHALT